MKPPLHLSETVFNVPILYLFLIIILLPFPALAEPDLLSFADSLAAEADHYRAITEYKRFIHYYPHDPRAAYAQLEIGKNLLAGKRWEQADQALIKVSKNYPGSKEAITAKQLYADAAYQRGDYQEAQKRYADLRTTGQTSDTAEIDYRSGLSALQQKDLEAARHHFAQLDAPLGQQLSLALHEYEQLPQKSPHLAGALSAILPGAGQLYTERPRQAGIAFALNASFIYAAIEAWDNENYTVSGLLSLFEIGWYGGNIYNAMNNAHKYNQRQRHKFLERFQQRFGLSLGWQLNHPELTAQFHF